jgi:four helix bundle protein
LVTEIWFMKTSCGFETSIIWKTFIEINKVIYKKIKPSENIDWDLIRQTKRAMISVGLNIAEGYSSYHSKEKDQFLNIAIGSMQEVKSCL